MSGFAIFYKPDSSAQDREDTFQNLLKLTAQYKQLNEPASIIVGKDCTAAKLDAPSSLHPGLVLDEQSGSWLMAAGTVVALEGNNDPKVLLKDLLIDFLDHNINALKRYDGHFALVLYNGRDESLSIISDPMGLFAIYYARLGQDVFISSSAMAVAKQGGSNADTLMIELFLRTGRPLGEKTLWKDVKRVLPATLIKITTEKLEEYEYWTPIVDKNIAFLPMNAALEIADEKIRRVISLSLSNNENVWADLTGGFDTRLITLYLDKLHIPFTTYCVGPEGHPDVEVSRLVSKEMGWKYHPMPLPDSWAEEAIFMFDEALGKSDGLLNLFQFTGVLKSAKDRSHSSLICTTGMGVDEWRYHILGANMVIPKIISKIDYDHMINAKLMDNIPINSMCHDRTKDVREEINQHFDKSILGYHDSPTATQIDIAFLRWRHPIHTGAYLSAQAGIMRSITPFCFKELENFGLSLNHQWRIKYDFRFVRNLMEKKNPRLANIITANDTPAIPIRLNNFHRFYPLWIHLGDILIGSASNKLIGRRVFLREPHHFPTYPLSAWKAIWMHWAVDKDLVTPEKMHSGALFNAAEFTKLVAQGMTGNYPYGEFLDRVITIEMALRATGASLE